MKRNEKGAIALAPSTSDTVSRVTDDVNYSIGATTVARLLAGENITDLIRLSDPWREIATAIVTYRNGRSAVDIFEEVITQRSDAAAIRAAVMSTSINEYSPKKTPEGERSFNDVPDLPSAARLSPGLMSDASGVGAMLNKYTEVAQTAVPISPFSFHEALCLSLISAVIARRASMPTGVHPIFPNTFILNVAESTLYGKTAALEFAKKLLHEAGLSFLMLPVGTSPQGLIEELTMRRPNTIGEWDQEDRLNWQEERKFAAQRLWLMDEAAALLSSFDQKHMIGLEEQILNLFNCPETILASSTVSRGRHTIRRAYLTFYGATTPVAMRNHIKRLDHWGNGFFPRMAFVLPDRPPIYVEYPPTVEIPSALSGALRSLAVERLPMPNDDGSVAKMITATMAPGVQQCWNAYNAALWDLMVSNRISRNLYPSYGRFRDLVMKIAILLSTADWSDHGASTDLVITMPHYARAQIITEQFRASLHRIVNEAKQIAPEQDVEAQIEKALRENPAGLTPREMAMALAMTEPRRRDLLDHVIARMHSDGVIEPVERRGARGPSARAWKPVKNPD